MEEFIEKLSNALMSVQLMHLYIDACFMSNVCLGCQIVDQKEYQEK